MPSAISLPYLKRQTKLTLLLWQQGLLSEEETLRTLYELSWSHEAAKRLMDAAYLLLPTM